MIAGTVSSTTLRVRSGGHVGTTYFNGYPTRMYGGALASSIIVMEVMV
jgi:hypothetical protein